MRGIVAPPRSFIQCRRAQAAEWTDKVMQGNLPRK
jgi:hypothetical protein